MGGKTFGFLLGGLLVLQFLAGLWLVDYPFVDGRYHYNWGPPFWLMHAQTINEIGLPATYFGLKDYSSHPQLIGPVIATWTSAFGYSEASIRLLALSLTVLATLFLTLFVRIFLGNRRALIFALFFAALPLTYIYGRKLDQEALVLLFLGVHLWGMGLLNQEKKKSGIAVATLGAFGMMFSDWSGAVFVIATALAALIIWGFKEKRMQVLMFAFFSFAGAGIALGLFALQSYLQSAADTIQQFIQGYINLWKYRAGQTEAFSWVAWLSKQFYFLSTNFSIPLFLAGVAGIAMHVRKSVRTVDENMWRVAVIASAVFLGNLAYMLIVPQASLVHIYYQYYFSVPVAVGLVLLLDFLITRFVRRKNQAVAEFVAVVVMFGAIAGYAAYQFNQLLFVDSYGDRSDAELIASIHDIPVVRSVITVNPSLVALLWFENPNIKYYTGRTIPTYHTSETIPAADYFIIPNGVLQDLVGLLESDTIHYGTQVTLTLVASSTNLYLIQATDSSAD